MSHDHQAHVEFEQAEVAAAFEAFDPGPRRRLLELRALIFNVAEHEDVGPLRETLKWGEPAYLTRPRRGTTIRLGSKAPDHAAMYVHCQSDVIPQLAPRHPQLDWVGTRELSLPVAGRLPEVAVREFIALALTYHRRRRAT